jgi:hypothetical protein
MSIHAGGPPLRHRRDAAGHRENQARLILKLYIKILISAIEFEKESPAQDGFVLARVASAAT